MRPEEISPNRLYHDLAELLPLVSPPKDYAEEARLWRNLLREKLGPGRHSVLELGVGGGFNLSHLTGEFEATAVDLSAEMLALCRQLNPGVGLHLGDMRTVRLGRTFAAVLIHDAISYMQTEDDLRATFATAAAHLESGGVFITSPDFFRETFYSPRVEHFTHSDGETELTYLEYAHDPDPADTTIELIMFYLIRRRGELRIEQDRHTFGLFPRATWKRLLEEAGFRVEDRQYHLGPDRCPYVLLVGTLARATSSPR